MGGCADLEMLRHCEYQRVAPPTIKVTCDCLPPPLLERMHRLAPPLPAVDVLNCRSGRQEDFYIHQMCAGTIGRE